METKQIEIKNYKNVYVAVDGTEFDDKDECLKYEKSAEGVLLGRLAKMAITTQSECELFNGAGCDDNTSHIIIPKSEDEVATIQQAIHLKSYGDKKKLCERVEVGKVLVVTIGYDNDGLWVTDLGEIVSKATDGRVELTEKK